jgi:hypothetical protein
MTETRLPRQLTEKYEALLGERTTALARIEDLDREPEYLDYSLGLLAPAKGFDLLPASPALRPATPRIKPRRRFGSLTAFW